MDLRSTLANMMRRKNVKKTRWGRFRILYLLLLILVAVSVIPLWFYGQKMVSTNREILERQENVLQTSISRSLAQEISLYMESHQRLQDFFDAVMPLAVRVRPSAYGTDPQLRATLEKLLVDRPDIIYATVLNNEARGVQSGGYNAASDAFLRKALEAAFVAVRQVPEYRSNPITILRTGANEPVIVLAQPVQIKGEFQGMVAAVTTLAPLLEQLQEPRRAGLEAYIVDNSGRLVASNDPDKNVAGMDMVGVPIVQKFLAWRGQARASETSLFTLTQNGQPMAMLGTYSPIPRMQWGVIVQRKMSEAFFSVDQMRHQIKLWGFGTILLSLIVGVVAAKSITRPIDQLTQTARSIAQRDYSQRAAIRSRTEIGELAQTFNLMVEDIQHYISDLKTAAEQNRQLFLESIEMIAAAVDAKDPYTKGHTRRVSQYSIILARELGLPEEEIEKIQVSATLHDVGKIGVEDRVLKKPGVLNSEEFEIMRRHTVMGYEIVRQVQQLADALPGIRWHHEALNGSGYPDGITGDQIPLMVRIISVADTFDAVSTDRPYQAGRDFSSSLEVLRRLAGTKYDPIVVDALHSAYAKGALREFEKRRRPAPVVVAAT
jgi:HD-GYP domain-containing protein (c-di-GMP phosphodiesterase class II)